MLKLAVKTKVMKSIWIWVQDWTAYIMLPIIYYVLRVIRSLFPSATVVNYKTWSDTDGVSGVDIRVFIVLVILSVIWLFLGLLWLAVGIATLVSMFLGAALFFELRKMIKNRKK